jgi:putative acetyltransferase
MYFLPELRGKGMGQELISTCLTAAQRHGFKIIYLETLKSMTQAQALYLKNGFKMISKPMGKTGHFGCDAWFALSI